MAAPANKKQKQTHNSAEQQQQTHNSNAEQLLPTPAQGDCGFYALVVATLCPVVDNETVFNLRLSRFLSIPLKQSENAAADLEDEAQTAAGPRRAASSAGAMPSNPPSLPAPPVFGHSPNLAPDQLTFRVFLRLYRNMRLSCNEKDSLFLKEELVGDPRIQQGAAQRCVAALRYLHDLVRYMRQMHVLYRRHRVEFHLRDQDFAAAPVSEEAREIEIERQLESLALPGTYISTNCTHAMACMFGMKLTTRWWTMQGDGDHDDEYFVSMEPDPVWQS